MTAPNDFLPKRPPIKASLFIKIEVFSHLKSYDNEIFVSFLKMKKGNRLRGMSNKIQITFSTYFL